MTYRQGRNYENLQKSIFDGAGPYDIPRLAPERPDVREFISFNFAKGCKTPELCGVHFFIDDYQFTRLWTVPDNYLDMLGRFKAVCTPDFSTYTDFPAALQIYNHYRKHWLGAYWQQNGITVIPTISWSDEASLAWCFDGEPTGGTVAVSSVGTQGSRRTRELFLAGYKAMMDRLRPAMVLFYGAVPQECTGNIVRLEAFQTGLKRRCKKQEDGI